MHGACFAHGFMGESFYNTIHMLDYYQKVHLTLVRCACETLHNYKGIVSNTRVNLKL